MEQAWLNGLAGGLLIGLSSAIYLLFNGRIAGMTGIIRNVMALRGDEAGVLSGAFLIGAFGAALTVALVFGAPAIAITTNPAAIVASGLIVGVGVHYGSGCTSGHGVVGMTRLSVRSIVATVTFMAATAATVFVLRHVFGIYY
jgi:uncharacterized membrane protein YedE/YeeE